MPTQERIRLHAVRGLTLDTLSGRRFFCGRHDDPLQVFFSREPRVLINRVSLSQTVDAINAALFYGRSFTATERGQAARWIAARHELPGAYGGTFAGFPSERSRGIVLFTGERIASASA